jgi:D-glycero-D-manno-heptose 1,7-bisphosphate phosphatase
VNKAAFLDRDGVINRKAPTEDEYVTCWEEMQILPGVAQAIALLNRAGFLAIVVSNQRSVAKGLITEAELNSIHRRMCDELARAGATIDGVYYCPHELEPPCDCRKPQPGMLLRAARIHDIDMSASWMIGDSDKDVQAGKNAGCRTVRVLRSYETRNGRGNWVARSLLEATHKILQWEKTATRQDVAVLATNLAHGRAS